ncbi:hypothetical protein K443DRAFT_675474, partial [Laccaria amethystina LaAM-08-1]
SIDIAHPSSVPPTLVTPSSTIHATDIAMQVTMTGQGVVECSQQVLPISSDFLSSHLPTSPPIVPVLNVGLVSVGAKMTVAFDQVEGSVQGAVDFLQHPSPILTDPPSSDLPTSLPISSGLNSEVMPTDFSKNLLADTINNISAQSVYTGPNY